MIEDFDKIRVQLRELAEVINSFKSEAVQLRLVELVFGLADAESTGDSDRAGADPPGGAPRTNRRTSPRKSTKSSASDVSGAKARGSGRPGGKVMLDRLVGENFFKKAKTIKQIVEHCEHNLAFKYKQSDFSGPLGRLTRDGALTRKKNADKQYEYAQA